MPKYAPARYSRRASLWRNQYSYVCVIDATIRDLPSPIAIYMTWTMGDGRASSQNQPCPAISVVMPVRNEQPYLNAAIASVLAQSFTDFELLIHDDGSTDGTGAILARQAGGDPRIRLFHSAEPLGVATACNRMIAQVRSPIIARMDADDVAHPDWLQRLYRVLVGHADLVLAGCLMSGMDATGRHVRDADRWRLGQPSVFPPFGHGSAIFRKAAFDRIGGYRPRCTYWEDFDLTLRLAGQGRIAVLPDTLYRYRFAATSTRLVSDQREVERAVVTMLRCAASYEATGDYEDVLAAGVSDVSGDPLFPRALAALSSNRVWNGVRPRQWRRIATAVLRRPRLRGFMLLFFATWAEINPASLRIALGRLVSWRSRHARLPLSDGALLWQPGATPRALIDPAWPALRSAAVGERTLAQTQSPGTAQTVGGREDGQKHTPRRGSRLSAGQRDQ